MRLQRAAALLLVLLFSAPLQAATWQRVISVVDGDTLILEGGEWVRLIGVDAPEMRPRSNRPECFAQEATAFARRLVEGKQVRLEHDGRRTDPYGRTLAYAWLRDGRELNAELLTHGYARVYLRCDCKLLERFIDLQSAAMQRRRGLWGTCR